MIEIIKQALIQILGVYTKKKGGNCDFEYDHSCYVRSSVPRCSGRIDSTSVLVPGKTLPSA